MCMWLVRLLHSYLSGRWLLLTEIWKAGSGELSFVFVLLPLLTSSSSIREALAGIGGSAIYALPGWNWGGPVLPFQYIG